MFWIRAAVRAAFLVLLAATALAPREALGVVRTWTGAGDRRLWSNPANWSGRAVPQPGDDVTITSSFSFPILMDQDVTGIGTFTLNALIEMPAGRTLAATTGNCNGGVILMSGGTVRGGIWRVTGSEAGFDVAGDAEATFDGVRVIGTLRLTHSGARVRLVNSPRFTLVRATVAGVVFAFPTGTVLAGEMEFIGGPPPGASFELDGPPGTLTVARGATVWLSGVGIGSNTAYPGVMTFVNEGVVNVYGDVRVIPAGGFENTGGIGGGAVVFDPGVPWVNRGFIGGSSVDSFIRGEWTNEGEIFGQTAVDSRFFTLEGTWINRGLIHGDVELRGQWRNEGTIGEGRARFPEDVATWRIGSDFRAAAIIRGRWDNTEDVLSFPGGWLLDGGELFGGDMRDSPDIPGAAHGFIHDLNYQGDLRLGSLVIGPDVRCRRGLIGDLAASFIDGVEIDFPLSLAPTNNQLWPAAPGASVTLGPGFSLTPLSPEVPATFSIGNGAGTITNRGDCRAQSGVSVDLSAQTIINEGTISAPTDLVRLAAAAELINRGRLERSDGTLTLVTPAWSSSGPIVLQPSSRPMVFSGATTAASVLTIAQTGAEVHVHGVVENSGSILELGAAAGSIFFDDCTIHGGSIRIRGAGSMRFNTPAAPARPTILDGVTVLDELLLQSGQYVWLELRPGTTVPSLRTSESDTTVTFAAGVPWDFPIALERATGTLRLRSQLGAPMRATASASLNAALSSGAVLFNDAGGVPSFDCAATINVSGGGRFTLIATSVRLNGPVTLSGPLTATFTALAGPLPSVSFAGPGGELRLTGAGLELPRLHVPASTVVSLSGAWSCSGPITMAGGTLRLGGDFTLPSLAGLDRAAGQIVLNGRLDLLGGEFAASAATGSITCDQGRISNGTIRQIDGRRFDVETSSLLTLSNVISDSEMVLSRNGSFLFPINGSRVPAVRVSAPAAGLTIPAFGTVDFPVVFDGPPGADRVLTTSTAGSLRIAPGAVVEARGVSAAIRPGSGALSLTVQGACLATGPAGLLKVSPNTLTNFDASTRTLTGGSWQALDGASLDLLGTTTLRVNNADVVLDGPGAAPDFVTLAANTGRLRLDHGRQLALNSSVAAFSNSGRLELGPAARLTVGAAGRTGDLTLGAAGTLAIDLAGPDASPAFGALRAFGRVTLGGALEARFLDGFAPACGSAFTLIDGDAPLAGALDALTPGDPGAGRVAALVTSGADAQLRVMPLADFDRSGFVDFFDYLDFVACFEAGDCPDADVNRDGFLDFFDYLDFVASFEEGC